MKYVKLHHFSQTENVDFVLLFVFLTSSYPNVTKISVNQTFLTRSGREIKSSELLLE